MKKIYLKPEIECAVVGAIWELCNVSGPTDNTQPTDPEFPFGGGMPGRRVF